MDAARNQKKAIGETGSVLLLYYTKYTLCFYLLL